MGRKKLGNVLFARRVHPSMVAALVKVIENAKPGEEIWVPPGVYEIPSGLSVPKGAKVIGYAPAPQITPKPKESTKALNAPPSKEAHNSTQYLTEISELKNTNWKLVEENERLNNENMELVNKITLLEAGSSDNEVIAGMAQKMRELKEKIKEYEQTYGG